MRRMALIFLLWIAGLTGALAQNPVRVIGGVTPGNCVQFLSVTGIKDAGIACGTGLFANPTAAVGLSAVNGVATTAMRSDAAPALSSSVQSALTGAAGAFLIGTGAFGFTVQNLPCTIAQGCTGQVTASAAFNALAPTPTRSGDIVYWNGSAWVTLAGNNSGTSCLQENASGVPSFASCASATSLVIGTTAITGGTSNGLLFNNGGVIGNTGAGTAGQQLVSNGSGAAPTYQSGGWVLLNTLTASGSATLSDTTHVTSTFNDYKLVFENIIPATNNVDCEIQIHTNSAFQTTNYQASTMYASAATNGAASTTAFIPCGHKNAATQNNGSGITGEIHLFNAASTTQPKIWTGTTSDTNSTPAAWISTIGGAYVGGNTAIDGFQVLFSSGLISSGTIKLYGRL